MLMKFFCSLDMPLQFETQTVFFLLINVEEWL